MRFVTLDHDTDFDGWRKAARALALTDVKPAEVSWRVKGATPDLFEDQAETTLPEVPAGVFSVPAKFVELAETAILHRDEGRFGLLYRLLWRLRANHDLMEIATDPDITQAHAMARAVRRDEHKMHAFVRFREIGREREARYVAWFEPEHHIVERAAPFFARRFADMPWSILTPELCAHWDGSQISFTQGVAKSEAPSEDRLEEVWRRYYASIFNPARLKVKAMEKEMPKKYWRNLPEAALIKPLIAAASQRTGAMIAEEGTVPHKPQKRVEETAQRTVQGTVKETIEEAMMTRPKASDDSAALKALREEAAHCRACPLWKDATQTVFGEGPDHAPLMLVGEQPGDKEDLAGHPFVGPAGQMLDRALKEAGIDRSKVYVTNAVKHFKFVPRGKIRLHQKPATPEIRACRQWYERELATVRPTLVVALGATAAQSVFGKIMPINKNRGHITELDGGVQALITVHPSYLLRLPDEDARLREYDRFVEDLKIAGAAMKRAAQAA